MYISIVIRGNFPFGGATANFLRYFALSLSYSGNKVSSISATGFMYGNNVDNLKKRTGKIGDVSFRYLGYLNNPKYLFGKLLNNLFGFILPIFYLFYKSLKRDVDTVVVYNPTVFTMLSYLIIKYLFRKQLVVIVPEFYEKPNTRFLSIARFKWYSFFYCAKYLLRYADKFIVLSQFLELYVKSRLKSLKPILIMPNLTDSELFEDVSRKPFLESIYTIGYVGTPTNKDGVLDLICSFGVIHKEFPKTHLLIIGDLTNGNTIISALKTYAKSQGLMDTDITFTGLLPYKDIPNLLASCQLLALTRPSGISAEAGFPSKLGEYFSCKRPVVITRVGDIPFYFEDKKHVFLANPNDIDSIVDSIKSAITDKELSERVALEGYQWMIQNLHYKNQAIRLKNFILS